MRGAEGQETRTLYLLSESMIPAPDLEGVWLIAPGIVPVYPQEQLIFLEYEGARTAKREKQDVSSEKKTPHRKFFAD